MKSLIAPSPSPLPASSATSRLVRLKAVRSASADRRDRRRLVCESRRGIGGRPLAEVDDEDVVGQMTGDGVDRRKVERERRSQRLARTLLEAVAQFQRHQRIEPQIAQSLRRVGAASPDRVRTWRAACSDDMREQKRPALMGGAASELFFEHRRA